MTGVQPLVTQAATSRLRAYLLQKNFASSPQCWYIGSSPPSLRPESAYATVTALQSTDYVVKAIALIHMIADMIVYQGKQR